MSHFATIVLLEVDGNKIPSRAVIQSMVDEVMEPFSEHLEVEQYREYMSDEDIQNMAEHYKIDLSAKDARQQIIEKIHDWHGGEGDYDEDEGRYFYWTTYNQKSKWDWYVIGGRWTGRLDGKGYEPDKDPKNMETCTCCKGTGMREDMGSIDAKGNKIFNDDWARECNGCNVCHGTGKSVKWNYRAYKGDIIWAKDIPKEITTHAILTPDGKWLENGGMGWFGIVIHENAPRIPEKPKNMSVDKFHKTKAFKEWQIENDKYRDILEQNWTKMTHLVIQQHKNAVAVMIDCHI